MAISIGQLFVRNWPIKLAAIFFAIMLYVAVAAQQPLTQSLAMHVAVAVPPGRSIRQQPANVTVVIIGKGTEVMKLRSISHVIHRVVPDTFSASVDRKSTRLNSSHGYISYAVFCLKKKKQYKDDDRSHHCTQRDHTH